ncbi:MAG: muramidase [Leptolyngbyaceae cyanobacterium]
MFPIIENLLVADGFLYPWVNIGASAYLMIVRRHLLLVDFLPTTSETSNQSSRTTESSGRGAIFLTAVFLLAAAWLISTKNPLIFGRSLRLLPANPEIESIPLAMTGGDPYVRALMRTISVAESHTTEPYHTLYGGQRINDLTQHPDRCIRIVAGPNVGNCTTAAGRYQFLTTTWFEKSRHYHPEPPRWYSWWSDYSFEPIYQDEVLYRWLTDFYAWNADIPYLLEQDRLDEVLYLLSGTWTSLGYGIEDNAVTPYLHEVYYQMLEKELQSAPQEGQ